MNEKNVRERAGSMQKRKRMKRRRRYMGSGDIPTMVLAQGHMATNHGKDETGVDCLVVSCYDDFGQMEIRY